MVVKLYRVPRDRETGFTIAYRGKTDFGLEFEVRGQKEILPASNCNSRLGGYDVEVLDFSDESVEIDFLRRSVS